MGRGGLHPLVYRVLASGSFVLLYGPPGSGKTTLALHMASQRGGSCVIATESGTLLALRHASPKPYAVYEIPALDEIPVLAYRCTREGVYVVIDSINAPYREAGATMEARRAVSLAAALLRESAERGVGGVATAQVSMDGGRVPGWELVAPWATHIARLGKRGSTFIVEFQKPFERILAFRVSGGVIEWL